MEELVGRWWHKAIHRWSVDDYEFAAVTLDEAHKTIGIVFRAAGGSAAIRIASSSEQSRGGYRSIIQRIAGSHTRADTATLEPEVLALPNKIALFQHRHLNHDLYIWLALHAACYEPTGNWLSDNIAATRRVHECFPGFKARYEQILHAHIEQRGSWQRLRGKGRLAEHAVQRALLQQACVPIESGIGPADVAPVWLWLNAVEPDPDVAADRPSPKPGEHDAPKRSPFPKDSRRRRSRRTTEQERKAPMVLPFRVESLLTWSEHINLNRATDDEDDGNALIAANDMDSLTVAANGETLAARVKFDLDLPSSSADDVPLGDGIAFPEWHFQKKQLIADHCSVQIVSSREATVFAPDPRLRKTAGQLRRRLEVLRDIPRPLFGQESGDSIDLDAWVRFSTDMRAGGGPTTDTPPVYVRHARSQRDLATLLLADLSLSTDAFASNEQRVIEVIRDALYVFGEGLSATGDAFAMWGFSSVRRQHVRLNHLKAFDDAWNSSSKARVGAIRPGYYTRMGAAIRFATKQLEVRPERRRLLMLLTDGKPNDLDVYEGRYGIEDTRQALHEARSVGLSPFCVTIDSSGHSYLPYLFGRQGYALVHRPTDLVQRLTQAWITLTK